MNSNKTASPPTGTYEMDAETYHATRALGSTTLRQFSSMTPKEFRFRQQTPTAVSDAMHLGTAIHTAVLEPELLADSIAIYTGKTRRGKAWDEFQEEHAGQLLLTQAQGEIVYAAASAIQEARTVYQFLQEGDSERSYFCTDPETGLELKTRPDSRGRMKDKRFLVDVKTIRALDDRTILKSMADHGYGAQAAHYMDVVAEVEEEPVEDFFFLFIRNTLPVDIRFMVPAAEWIEAGRERNRKALRGLAECMKSNEWPGYPVCMETIECPEWARKTA